MYPPRLCCSLLAKGLQQADHVYPSQVLALGKKGLGQGNLKMLMQVRVTVLFVATMCCCKDVLQCLQLNCVIMFAPKVFTVLHYNYIILLQWHITMLQWSLVAVSQQKLCYSKRMLRCYNQVFCSAPLITVAGGSQEILRLKRRFLKDQQSKQLYYAKKNIRLNKLKEVCTLALSVPFYCVPWYQTLYSSVLSAKSQIAYFRREVILWRAVSCSM